MISNLEVLAQFFTLLCTLDLTIRWRQSSVLTNQKQVLTLLTNQKTVFTLLTNQNTPDPGTDTPGQCRHHSHGQYQ